MELRNGSYDFMETNRLHCNVVFQVGDSVIGTHFIDLSTISNDGKTGEFTQLNVKQIY